MVSDVIREILDYSDVREEVRRLIMTRMSFWPCPLSWLGCTRPTGLGWRVILTG